MFHCRFSGLFCFPGWDAKEERLNLKEWVHVERLEVKCQDHPAILWKCDCAQPRCSTIDLALISAQQGTRMGLLRLLEEYPDCNHTRFLLLVCTALLGLFFVRVFICLATVQGNRASVSPHSITAETKGSRALSCVV